MSGAIRFFTRRIGEAPTRVNHAGMILHGGGLRAAWIVEALRTVVCRSLLKAYANRKNDVAVYRCRGLDGRQRQALAEAARVYIGRRYGYVKIVAHALDWVLQGAYVFRRFTGMDRYPICSWLVAQAYSKQGLNFGVAPGAASPDDLWDFVTKRTDLYECIIPLGPLSKSA